MITARVTVHHDVTGNLGREAEAQASFRSPTSLCPNAQERFCDDSERGSGGAGGMPSR
jgi:hypothetical protein